MQEDKKKTELNPFHLSLEICLWNQSLNKCLKQNFVESKWMEKVTNKRRFRVITFPIISLMFSPIFRWNYGIKSRETCTWKRIRNNYIADYFIHPLTFFIWKFFFPSI